MPFSFGSILSAHFCNFFIFYFLLLHDADCCCLHPTTSANFLFFMISTRCLLMLSADTYYCNTYYKRSAAYACCLHQVSLRTPLKKGRCSSVSWHSWSRHSQGRLTNTTITTHSDPAPHTTIISTFMFTNSIGSPPNQCVTH